MKKRVLVLEGDGIGPEVTRGALAVLRRAVDLLGGTLELEHAAFGGAALDETDVPVTEDTLARAQQVDAVLLGAVGGPKWDEAPSHLRPERGLLQLRKTLGVYANLRPARLFPSMEDACPLKPSVARNFDFVVVRELTGGIYFGEPRGVSEEDGQRVGVNTMRYSSQEVERVGLIAFEAARARQKRVMSVDKANVLEVQQLWRTVMQELAGSYPDVELQHMYVDNCAMQLCLNPSQFDVVVTGNLFGDILSDEAGAITGSIGLLPSASLGDRVGLYEPVHGSAPDIAGQNKANPLAAILSVGMLLEHSFGELDLAASVRGAVEDVLRAGLRTADLAREGEAVVSTETMTQSVLDSLS